MTADQLTIAAVLIGIVALFIWNRWRHDFVALAALLVCVFTGLVPADGAFAGFAHPAVITVAGVLILSGVPESSGTADALMRAVMPAAAGPTLTITCLTGLSAAMSAFMNNVGALALLMPMAIQIAARQAIPAGRLLMPLAFGSILGGMTTLIGTPPNLIVSGINLLAVSRQGRRTVARLRSMALMAGDVVLLQGERDALNAFALQFGCAPLAQRPLKLPRKREVLLSGVVMAVGVGAAAFGLVPAAVSFAGAALACVLLRLMPPRRFYDAVDWSVVVLLGALIPVAQAVADTGTAALIGRTLVEDIARGQPVPALILGPGGGRFGDYWQLGLPLEIIVIAVGVPMILAVWPL